MVRTLLILAVAALSACARPEPGVPAAAAPTLAPTTTTAAAPTTTTTAAPARRTTATSAVTAPTTTTAVPAAPVIELGEYAVVLTGTAGGRGFERPAQLSVTGTITATGTTNGVNEIDVCLISGFPAAGIELGATWFGTNTGCLPSVGVPDLDLAHTTVSGATVTVRPDTAIPGLNAFASTCLHQVADGAMEVTFGFNGRVTGTITARGSCGNGDPLDYTATFTGTRL
ncbi:hypothetical protein [Actinokineospora sp. NPDC004072]